MPPTGSLDDVRAALAKCIGVPDLQALWRARTEVWDQSPEIYLELARRLVRRQELFLCYDVASAGLKSHPDSPHLRQTLALALARMGLTEQANELLRQLESEGHDDEQTLGLLGRTHKDMALHASSEDEKQHHLDEAHGAYRRAYETSGRSSAWTGINSATMSVITGRLDEARSIASEVFATESARLSAGSSDYWLHATLGEATLILGRSEEAAHHYAEACKLGAGEIGDIATTRRQMRLLARHLSVDSQPFDDVLKVPRVVVFSGHMIDRPDRPEPRFPASEEARVAAEIRQRLEGMDAGLGYASAACGADILFLEAMLERGGEIHVFLPHSAEEFCKRSVDFADGWHERFERVLAAAASVLVANDKGASDHPADYEFVNLVRDGSALLKARTIESSTVGLAVWDGRKGDGRGGTDSAVSNWQLQGIPVEVIAPLGTLPEQGGRSVPVRLDSGPSKQIVALIFADVVGYSGMGEELIPAFVERFMQRIANMVDAHDVAPLARNTWGDAIYLVYEHPADAFVISAALRDIVHDTDWESEGLPAGLNLRIGLHAGPVFALTDPVTRQPAYTGAQVSRAARIEPIAPPGEIYASESFAALAELHSIGGCVCSYVGKKAQAKGYGTYATYHVKRAPC